MNHLLCLCILGLAVSCYAGKAPFITPCKIEDNACILSSAQAAVPHVLAGIPELGVTPGDPLVVENLKSEEGDLKLEFKHLKIVGISKCVFKTIDVNPDKSSLKFSTECPIEAHGHYTASGKLVFVPIEGDGAVDLKTEKIRLFVDAKLDIVDGHWHVLSLDHSYELVEKVHIKLDNLFNGDEKRAEPADKIINGAWQEIMITIGKPIIAELVHTVKGHIQEFLKAVPANEFFLA